MADYFYDNYHCGCDFLFFTCSSGKKRRNDFATVALKAAHKTGNFMHEQNKRRIENVKIKVYF